MADSTKQYRFIGSHAETLANGRPVEPGEFVDLTDEDVREAHNEMLIADGSLIGTDEKAEHQTKLASSRVDRRVDKIEEANDPEEES